MTLEIHPGSKGFYLQYPDGFNRTDVEPPASGWFANRRPAEAEALRLAETTGKAFLVIKVVSKCVPWHCDWNAKGGPATP